MNDIAEYIQRGKSPKYSEIEQIPVIAQKCNQWSGFNIKKAKFIIPETISTYSEERLLQDKDLLWNSTGLGTLGRMAIYEKNKNPYGIAVADSHVTVLRMFKTFVIPEYVFLWISSPAVQLYIEAKSEGTTKQKELYVNTVKNHMIPLPPLNEQRKILDKYNTFNLFLTEYNEYEIKNTELETNFPKLLKKSLLQYAIQGKLVPQDPNDEPASVLLERIRAEKEQLIKEGKIKRDKNDSYIYRGSDNSYYEKFADGKEVCIDEEIAFEIPENWCWCRLGSISTYAQPKQKINAQYANSNIWELDLEDIEKGGKLLDIKTVGERKAKGDKTFFNKNDILYSKLRPYLLKVLIAHDNGICTPEIVPFSMYGSISNEYIVNCLKTPFIDTFINKITYGIKMPRVGTETMIKLLIPIPPLAEQKQICNMLKKINDNN